MTKEEIKELQELYTKTFEKEKPNNEFLQKLLQRKKEINNTIPTSNKEYDFLKSEMDFIDFQIKDLIFKKMFSEE